MVIFKKVFFSLPFLISYLILIWISESLITTPNNIFSFDIKPLIQSIYTVLLLLLTSFFFVVFVSISMDYLMIIPVVILAAISTFFLIPAPFGIILAFTSLLALSLTTVFLDRKMRSYLTFSTWSVLFPYIKTCSTLLIMALVATSYFSSNMDIEKNGFQIPDSLIDLSLNFSQNNTTDQLSTKDSTAGMPQLSSDQITLLKQNPDLLKQYGLDPSFLNQIDVSQVTNQVINPKQLVKSAVKSQVDKVIKPYLGYIPFILSLLLFISLNSLAQLLSFLPGVMIWLLFWILEKTGFFHFEIEQRDVRKLVV